MRWCGPVLLLWSCSVELEDVPGRACDEAHPCRAPRACVQGACWAPGEQDGDGGADAGDLDAGLGDGGTPVWQQRLHGFTGTTVEPNCTVDIDPTRGNRVLASVGGSDDAQDTARADMVDPARLPMTLEGRVRGRVTLPAPLAVRGLVPFVYVGTQTGLAWVRVGFDEQGRLVVDSDPQTVALGNVTERFVVDGGFRAGDWVVDVAWRRGGFRQVRINDVLYSDVPALTGGATAPPTELSLGPARYDGDAGAPFSLTLSGWQLADDVRVRLGDVP